MMKSEKCALYENAAMGTPLPHFHIRPAKAHAKTKWGSRYATGKGSTVICNPAVALHGSIQCPLGVNPIYHIHLTFYTFLTLASKFPHHAGTHSEHHG
jgi:hypothetical protein